MKFNCEGNLKYIFVFFRNTNQATYLLNSYQEFFYKYDYKFLVLHINKYSSNISTIKATIANDLFEYFDLTSLNGFIDIKTLIAKYNPHAFLFFGFRSIYDLFLIKLSNYFSIKAIYIDHGIMSQFRPKINKKEMLILFRKQLFALKLYTWLIIEKSNSFVYEFLNLSRAIFLSDYSLFKFDMMNFFSKYNFDQLKHLFKLNKDNYRIIGYPIVTYKQDTVAIYKDDSQNRVVLIHQPFILDDLSKISYSIEKEYFAEICRIINENNFQLTLQVHPRESIARYKNYFNKDNNILVTNQHLTDNIKSAKIVLGFNSAALLSALYFNKLIITLDYPYLKNNTDIFKNVSINLTSLKELELLLKAGQISNYEVDSENREYLIGYINSFEEFSNLVLMELKNNKTGDLSEK